MIVLNEHRPNLKVAGFCTAFLSAICSGSVLPKNLKFDVNKVLIPFRPGRGLADEVRGLPHTSHREAGHQQRPRCQGGALSGRVTEGVS
jgi:hypothetical protein